MSDDLDQHRRNRAIYESQHRQSLERDHNGEHVLMHDGEIIDRFAGLAEAYDTGIAKFGEGNFSIIEIGLHFDLGALNHLIG